MDKKALEAFAREAAKGIKTQKDLNDFSQMLTKITVETALGAELDDPWAMTSISPHRQTTAVMAIPARR